MKTYAFVDGHNLIKAARSYGYEVDFSRFRLWLKNKYDVQYCGIYFDYIDDLGIPDLEQTLYESGFEEVAIKYVFTKSNGKYVYHSAYESDITKFNSKMTNSLVEQFFERDGKSKTAFVISCRLSFAHRFSYNLINFSNLTNNVWTRFAAGYETDLCHMPSSTGWSMRIISTQIARRTNKRMRDKFECGYINFLPTQYHKFCSKNQKTHK